MKNRRCRDAKISEYKLEKLVRSFAENLTVKDTAERTGLSEPTVRRRFMELRQTIFDHGFLRVQSRDSDQTPARYIFDRKHRGSPERYKHLYEAETLHRIFATKNIRAVQRFKASDAKAMEKIKRLVGYNATRDKYDIIEMLERGEPDDAQKETRPFDPADYEDSSTIIVNERNLDPADAFFRWLWGLLLKHPL
ncbi:MAG: hypothetical protein CMF74_10000 [Maricaulis sp.]|jgi:AraC-like DNA-binding protein|nr:hypothetical protein [Maricaulis sp.]HAQ34935.1 hypothetical protein [Alphaproteobacteria bacterium]|tara:strand:+ start:1663 stop:2244 length:582 start_codon:yes stop_codon:yes gene_type:complete